MQRFSVVASQLLSDPAAFRANARAPLLLWEAGPLTTTVPRWATDPGSGRPRPSLKDPVLVEVRKRAFKNNGFGLGITVGRTANNDVQLDDPTISRFHAYFKADPSGLFQVVDVESQNGTFLGGHRLAPGKPAPLFGPAEIRFGDVALTFFALDAFEAYVRAKQRDVAALDGLRKPRGRA